jgi:hypothetical protein
MIILSKSFGDQDLDRVAWKFVGVVSEKLVELRVRFFNAPGCIRHNNSVRRKGEECFEERLAFD